MCQSSILKVSLDRFHGDGFRQVLPALVMQATYRKESHKMAAFNGQRVQVPVQSVHFVPGSFSVRCAAQLEHAKLVCDCRRGASKETYT